MGLFHLEGQAASETERTSTGKSAVSGMAFTALGGTESEPTVARKLFVSVANSETAIIKRSGKNARAKTCCWKAYPFFIGKREGLGGIPQCHAIALQFLKGKAAKRHPHDPVISSTVRN